jgi:NosR/NirI family transcriptional regulator, nitrite reductase regulator
VDRLHFESRSWKQLADESAIRQKIVTFEDASLLFGKIAAPLPEYPGTFIDVWVALLDPPTIGQNLLGRKPFERIFAGIGSSDSAVLIASSGLHSHRGTAYLGSGVFDRIEIIQGDHTIRLKKDDYLRLDALALPDAPQFNELSVFRLAAQSGFNAAQSFRVEVVAERAKEDGTISSIRIPQTYELPRPYVNAAQSAPQHEEPLWIEAWRRKPATIATVAMMIVLVGAAFFGQEWFVRRPSLWRGGRISFLTVTLLFLGWWANGQLSVVQVVAFFHSVLNGFRWETFLIEPVIFVLWAFVALGLLFWGRGVYCGWLCPFGALQEILNEVAKRFGVKQVEVPYHIQERLWAIKYTLFMLILGLSFYSMDYALKFAEVEPFKTAIAMRFQRAWPFVAFVFMLLGAGLFIERFYCRYLCPLGAALAIPAKMKLFDWLHRRPQCGRECRFCETQCTVGAIDTLGRINPNECVLCLKCQVILNDNAQCIVLKRRAGRTPEGQGATALPLKATASNDLHGGA